MDRSPSENHLQQDKFLNALADAYRLQETIMAATELAIISTSPEGIITSFNKAAEDLLGYTAEEVIGRSTPVIFHDQQEIAFRASELTLELGYTVKAGFEAIVEKARIKNLADRKEWVYIRKDGSRFPVLISVTALWNENENLIGYAGIAGDITKQKKAELLRKESQEHLRALVSSLDDIVFELDEHGRFHHIWVKSDEHLFLPRQQIYGRTLAEMFGEAFAAPFDKGFRNVLRTGETFNHEYKTLSPNDERWFNAKYSLIYDHGKPTNRVSVCIQDITARKRAEEELKRVADENNRVFNYSINLNAIASFDGYYTRVNPVWEKILGWSVEELTSTKFMDFVHPDDLFKTTEVFEHLLQGNDITMFECRHRCKDGSYRWLLWTSSPDVKHKLIYASAVDITDRKKSEEDLLRSKNDLEIAATELEEQNRQLDEFAHIISHNLRSPVGNIKALINFINDKSTVDDHRVIFEKIRKVANNLSETMNELMETLKVKKNTEVEQVEIRFKDVLDKVVQSLEGDLIQCGATVTFDFNNAPKILYSKTYLESIFQNLLSNAVKYRSPDRKPQIHVTADIAETGVELRFTDNGLGIDLEKYGKKIFGLHKTFHEHKEARGVGLFLTKTQIEAMGGSITAESEVDVGTTFIIRF
jgi:PAS domain S-box-containing protein